MAAFVCAAEPEMPQQGSFPAESEAEQETETEEEPETILASDIDFPVRGEQYGEIRCERIGFCVPVFWDDTDAILDLGAGTSLAGYLPGLGKVIILSGHTLTHFRSLEYLETGDVLVFDTDYGHYEYEITAIEVYDENDLLDLLIEKTGYEEESEEDTEETAEAVELTASDTETPAKTTDETAGSQDLQEQAEPEELLLYTCYPFYPISERKTNRYTVIAQRVSGPEIMVPEETAETKSEKKSDKTGPEQPEPES